jgi:6-pyruvoyltetrahydropterin/6-carboxytetrahydropterin synthase
MNSVHDNKVLTRHVASARFEAARQVLGIQGNKFTRLHGHGFLVSAFVDSSSNQATEVSGQVSCRDSMSWPPYPGGEVPALFSELQQQAKRLDYQSLNEFVAQPSDVNLARWFADQLSGSQPAVSAASSGSGGIALQSTPEQGVMIGLADGSLVWRRYPFQAAHQLPNVPAGHKCGRLHGHGFEVVLYAVADCESVDYETLDRAWSQVSNLLNYRCLNDVEGLENPTSEMLSSWLWQKLKGLLPSLSAVTVYETASCGATFNGEIYRIWKDFTIDSAVRYRHASLGSDHARASVHGYTYTLRLNLSAPLDQVMGWTVDFGDVKEVFNPVFKSLDHHPLHEHTELSLVSDGDTGSIAKWIFMQSRALLPQLVRVDLFETQGCGSSVGIDLQAPALPLERV